MIYMFISQIKKSLFQSNQCFISHGNPIPAILKSLEMLRIKPLILFKFKVERGLKIKRIVLYSHIFDRFFV